MLMLFIITSLNRTRVGLPTRGKCAGAPLA